MPSNPSNTSLPSLPNSADNNYFHQNNTLISTVQAIQQRIDQDLDEKGQGEDETANIDRDGDRELERPDTEGLAEAPSNIKVEDRYAKQELQ